MGSYKFVLLIFSLFFSSCGGGGNASSRQSQAETQDIKSSPFSGAVSISPDIITSADTTTFLSLSYEGEGLREMYDKRLGANGAYAIFNVYLFNATYDDGDMIEVQVNSEFGSVDAAEIPALLNSEVLGRIPVLLREKVENLAIHKGNYPYNASSHFRTIYIHTAFGDELVRDGYLEEVLVHEGAHISLDLIHKDTPAWLLAQEKDQGFISDYAARFQETEDLAESFGAYLAVRYRADRISASVEQAILDAIPNRIDYFDAQTFVMYPID